jgi:hypothetical protein
MLPKHACLHGVPNTTSSPSLSHPSADGAIRVSGNQNQASVNTWRLPQQPLPIMEPAHPKVARPSFCLHPASALSAASSYVLRTERGRDSVVSARIEAPTTRIAVAAGAATVTGFWVAAARPGALQASTGSGSPARRAWDQALFVDDPGNSRARHGDAGRDNHPLNSD